LLGISGSPLDFDDPEEPGYTLEGTAGYVGNYVIPILVSALLLIFIISMIVTGNITKESLITILILTILAVVTITLIT
jgi:hypothetical protein